MTQQRPGVQGAKLSSGQGKEEGGAGGGTAGRRFREVQLQEPIRSASQHI